jgi:uncharacterized membrane protein YbhN (UPF0104 family)
VLAGIGILIVLGLQLGADPFVDALRGIGVIPVLIALVVTAGTTLCCARRWNLMAERLDVGVPIPAAFRAVYRAQFLNVTLPSGMVGEVDRALWHGHSSRAMARGIRSVVWDRFTGQVVIFGLVLLTLPALDPTVRTWMLWLLAGTAVAVMTAASIRTKYTRALWTEVKSVPCARHVWPRVLVLSVLSAAGHVTLFTVAARAVGVDAPTVALVPVGLVIQQVAAIPLTVAGWGPREGATALIFAASGLGAERGLEVSVAYGVLTIVGALPGVLTLRRRRVPPADSGAEQVEGGRSWQSARTQS